MPKPTGRPWTYDQPANERICLKTTPAQLLELKRVAAENGLTLSGVLREAVTEFCADYWERRPKP